MITKSKLFADAPGRSRPNFTLCCYQSVSMDVFPRCFYSVAGQDHHLLKSHNNRHALFCRVAALSEESSGRAARNKLKLRRAAFGWNLLLSALRTNLRWASQRLAEKFDSRCMHIQVRSLEEDLLFFPVAEHRMHQRVFSQCHFLWSPEDALNKKKEQQGRKVIKSARDFCVPNKNI